MTQEHRGAGYRDGAGQDDGTSEARLLERRRRLEQIVTAVVSERHREVRQAYGLCAEEVAEPVSFTPRDRAARRFAAPRHGPLRGR